MYRSTITALAATLLAAGCAPTESEDHQPPAEELQSFSPAEVQEAEEDRLLDAPDPVVEEAVESAALEVEEGHATFYADVLEGRRTASGRTFRQAEMVAAHRAFPFGTRLRVTNTSNNRAVDVEVVDRGPFGQQGSLPAVLDLSKAAARQLGFLDAGRAQVRIEVMEWGP